MAYEPSVRNTYSYFETGIVEECNMKNGTCTVLRSEGGRLEHVPVLNVCFGDSKSASVHWPGNFKGSMVALIPIQGILCVLGTLPMRARVKKEEDSEDSDG